MARGDDDTESKRKPDYTPPPLPPPTARTLTEAHRRHLRESSGLTDATIDAADLYSIETRDEAIALLGRTHPLHSGFAIAIPFHFPGAPPLAPFAFRVRPDHPWYDKQRKRHAKYDQPSGVGIMVYFPPRARADGLLQADGTQLWTEGEKKALALEQLGYTVVGLTGVDSWSAKRAKGDRGPRTIHPTILAHVRITGREHVLVYDQDAWENAGVMRAAHAFADALRAAGASAVWFVTPPKLCPCKGIDDYLAMFGAEQARQVIEQDAQVLQDPAELTATAASAVECLAGAPIPADMVIPRGYQISATGLVTCAAGDRTVVVGPAPIMITARAADYVTGEQNATVTWKANGAWATAQVTRKALIDARAMVAELGPVGAPVTSQTAKYMAPWFLALELANESVLPVARAVSHTGWIGVPGEAGAAFVLDHADGFTVAGELDRVAPALRPRGDFEAHAAALRRAWDTGPIMRRIMCAALAATLLKPLRSRGFALHLCGDSSRGKTTMLRIAASIFGDPDDPAWVATWNTTANAAELRAATLSDLPLCYDEVGASDPVTVQRLIYTLANGESRGRLTATAAAQRARHWRTVVLSAGEIPLGEGMATGAQARVVALNVEGFGTLDGDAAAIHALASDCARHAGSFGARWIADLLAQDPDGWAHIVKLRDHARAKYLGDTKAAGVRSRTADYYSLLGVVEALLVQAYGFAEHESVCSGQHADGVDPEPIESAAEAMAAELETWIASNPEAFPTAQQTTRGSVRPPHSHPGPRHGIRVVDDTGEVIETWLNARSLRDLFVKHNRSYMSVMREWAKAGRIETTPNDDRFRPEARRTIVNQGKARYVVWKRTE
jgi:hypothetical protein